MANPFQELRARLEAEAKKQTTGKPDAPQSGRVSAPTAPTKPGRATSSPPFSPVSPASPTSDDADAALFLRSVTASPLPKNPRTRPETYPGGRPMPPLTPASPPRSAAPRTNRSASPSPASEPVATSLAASASAPPPPSASSSPPEDDLFASAMRGVAPIAAKGRDIHAPAEAAPNACPGADPASALRDLLDGKIEFAVCHTEEYMEGFVAGLDPVILGKLRSGSLSPEAHLDLHGQNARQALDSLMVFMKHAYTRGLRTVLVVTGRGRNSPDGIGILRLELQKWLTRDPFKRVVLAFCTAQTHDGGPGAVYVLLRKYKKSRGKIVWERGPGDDDGMM